MHLVCLSVDRIPSRGEIQRAGSFLRVCETTRAAVSTLGLAMCAVPMSIAVAETLLLFALTFRVASLFQRTAALRLPRIFWFWLPWAALEIMVWLCSPDARAGQGEIRHLLLIAALFLVIPAIDRPLDAVKIWRGIFLGATVSSSILIARFVLRWIRFHREIAALGDPSAFLRGGGLLNHWAIYGTVELTVFAALLEYWHRFPRERRYLIPAFGLQGLAIVLSLTRSLWLCCLLILALHLAWRRSKWILAVPILPAVLFLLPPVRFRVTTAMEPSYYSNAERLQMLRVGAKMIREHPVTGVGPGRVEALYTKYLSPIDPVPAYHGHLHNNLVQLAAQFGLPVVLLAAIFTVILFRALLRPVQFAQHRENEFLRRTAVLALSGFVASGSFDYTYGHSLGLILLSYAVLVPLVTNEPHTPRNPDGRRLVPESSRSKVQVLASLDRITGALLLVASLWIVIVAAAVTRILSRRSPFVAHLRIGKNGDTFWVWKLRTMWSRDESPARLETGWVERIDCDPQTAAKPENDPRITSRFARWCRRYSIDELPQLFHVLRGQMSLVGPRPLTRGELRRHYGASANEVLSLKPGLTGYWQTRGRNRLSYPERVALDLQLTRDLSALVYFQILLRTIPLVLGGKNAW